MPRDYLIPALLIPALPFPEFWMLYRRLISSLSYDFQNHTILNTTAFHSEVSLTMSSKGDRLAGKVAIVTGETILSHIPSVTCNDISPVVIPRRWVWLRCSNSNPLRFPRMLCSRRRHQRGGRRKDSKR